MSKEGSELDFEEGSDVMAEHDDDSGPDTSSVENKRKN
jgi:hypothetical protein